RADTEETVFAGAEAVLTGIDDTQPSTLSGLNGLQRMTMSEPLRLTFNEPVQAGSFSVVKTFKDYTGRADEDISERFELVNVAPESISLRLRQDQVLDYNASYAIVINDVADTSGNLAEGQ